MNLNPKMENENVEIKDAVKTSTIVDEAIQAAERLEKANAEKKALIDREENLLARKALGGKSEGKIPEQPKEESPRDYAKKIMSGRL